MPAKQFGPEVGVGWRPSGGTAEPRSPSAPPEKRGKLGALALVLALIGLCLSIPAGSSPVFAGLTLLYLLVVGVLSVIAMARRGGESGSGTAGLVLSMVSLLILLCSLGVRSVPSGGG